jgi:hypothetical protein
MSKQQIDYDAIEFATAKVTTGFRCEPELKLELIQEAEELGRTLSEHLEHILTNRHKELPQLLIKLQEAERTIVENQETIDLCTKELVEQDDLISDLKSQLKIK